MQLDAGIATTKLNYETFEILNMTQENWCYKHRHERKYYLVKFKQKVCDNNNSMY